MPSITIRETDNTLYGLSNVNSDNIVYVPGSAITGPYDAPVLLGSYQDLIDNFGDHGCEGSYSWDYAANLLASGMPVLYQRIAQTNMRDFSPTLLVNAAKYEMQVGSEDPKTLVATFSEIYGGTYGNSLRISLKNENNTVFLRVYRVNKLIESASIAQIPTGDPQQEEINKLVLEGLKNVTMKTIKVTIDDEEAFVFNPIDNQPLTGGTDADESKIVEELSKPTLDESPFGIIVDKYIYDVKFVTSGGYVDSNLAIAKAMNLLATTRQDCLAIPDLPLGTDSSLVASYFKDIDSSYCAAYAPWVYIKLMDRSNKWMPPSYAFLSALAASLINNPIWYPPAGVDRASLPNVIRTEYEIGESLFNEWQNNDVQAINPIMKMRNYGYVIFGQRTLYVAESANAQSSLKSVNVRITANEIKRAIFNACISLTFEQNILRTWNEFKSALAPTLNDMKNNRGLTDYLVIMDNNTTTEQDIQENRVRGIVRVSIVNAVEHFDIGFNLEPSSVTFNSDETVLNINED